MEEEKFFATGVPSKKQQEWGALISIVVIVFMIVVGAFYAWGKRISEQNAFNASAAPSSVQQ